MPGCEARCMLSGHLSIWANLQTRPSKGSGPCQRTRTRTIRKLTAAAAKHTCSNVSPNQLRSAADEIEVSLIIAPEALSPEIERKGNRRQDHGFPLCL